MRLVQDPSSRRSPTYREYFGDVSRESAARVLWLMVGLILCIELGARMARPVHERTPIDSMHGIRWLFEEANLDAGPKVIAVGDSSLLGGGVHDHDRIVMGRLARSPGLGRRVFNFGVPGGDCSTSALLLDALNRTHAANVERVIIEVLPNKLFATTADGLGPTSSSIAELSAFVPEIRPEVIGVQVPPPSLPQRVESELQYNIGMVSAAYRARDGAKIEEVGNYPSFWLVGQLLPASLRVRLLSTKGTATNRFGARLDDGAFEPASRDVGFPVAFAALPQARFLRSAIESAIKISGHPPVIVQMPFHYEFTALSDAETAQTLRTLDMVTAELQGVCDRTGSTMITVDSRSFQDPRYWTRTAAHPSALGHAEIWRRYGPTLLKALQ